MKTNTFKQEKNPLDVPGAFYAFAIAILTLVFILGVMCAASEYSKAYPDTKIENK